MIGSQHIIISNRKAKYEFDITRNLTIIRGDSGTGKTTLYNMVADYSRLAEASGVNLSCAKKCVALIDSDWKHQLSHTSDSIVFIDEGFDDIKTEDFALAVKRSDNYYVIFNRESLASLPYSVEEIYEIKTSGKFHSLEKVYTATAYHVYGEKSITKKFVYNILLTEDSGAGFQFFRKHTADSEVECVAAASKSKILSWLKKNPNTSVLIVADGAAFGPEIDKIIKWNQFRKNTLKICLPESFEWLILKSGLIKGKDLNDVLESPEDHIESSAYFSWENFFYDYLVKCSADTPFHYTKRYINKNYLTSANAERIVLEIAGALSR